MKCAYYSMILMLCIILIILLWIHLCSKHNKKKYRIALSKGDAFLRMAIETSVSHRPERIASEATLMNIINSDTTLSSKDVIYYNYLSLLLEGGKKA